MAIQNSLLIILLFPVLLISLFHVTVFPPQLKNFGHLLRIESEVVKAGQNSVHEKLLGPRLTAA